MREILFRGKDSDNGEWREGYLYVEDAPPVGILAVGETPPQPTHWIIFKNPRYFPDWNLPWQYCRTNVDPLTIGQFTGLTDKNGVKIFDGDVCKDRHGEFEVRWDNKGGARFLGYYRHKESETKADICYVGQCDKNDKPVVEVIGNIHNNPELIGATP